MPQYIQVGKDVIEFPDNMSDEQITAVLRKQETPSQQVPEQKYSGFLMGLKDPLSGGAQLLEQALPKSLVTKINEINNELAKYGLVSPVGAGGVTEQVAKEQQAYQAQRKAQGEGENIDWARVAGNIVSPANLAVGGVAGSLATAPARQAALVGATQGVLTPTAETENFATEKAQQAGAGAVGGVVGGALVKGAGKVLSPAVSAAEQKLRDLGVQLTPGQLIGETARDVETFATNLFGIGPSISAAKERAIMSFNKGVINKTLDKIGDKLPENATGRNAILYAADQVSNAYDDVLSKMKFNLDFKTTSGLLNALDKAALPSAAQKETAINELNKVALSRFDKTTLTGNEYKLIESDLRKLSNDYMISDNMTDKQIGQALKDVLGVFKDELAKQNPKQTSKLRRIDSAYGDLEVIQTAAANSGAEGGIFTPKQYQTAVRQRDITRNKKSFARGTARGQEVSDAAVNIMGESPRANIEGRIYANTAGLLGGAQNPYIAVPLAIATPVMYSESGIKTMEALMRSRPEIAKKIGNTLVKRATREGSITGAQVLEAYNNAIQTSDIPRIELNNMAPGRQ
jgi:hypothetical protein